MKTLKNLNAELIAQLEALQVKAKRESEILYEITLLKLKAL